MNFLTTVTGSYPRQQSQKDTLRKPSVSDEEALEMIKWASEEQANLGLDIITDGECYRENMYWFYQLRLDGVDAINKKYKHFSTGGSMEGVDLSKTHGTKGFGIECAVIKDEIKNDITKVTPCSFEPSIDYIVTKIPRFDFEPLQILPKENKDDPFSDYWEYGAFIKLYSYDIITSRCESFSQAKKIPPERDFSMLTV